MMVQVHRFLFRAIIKVLLLLPLLGAGRSAFAQTDTADAVTTADTVPVRRYYQPPSAAATLLDSVANALANRQYLIGDSLSKIYINKPDPERHNQFVDTMFKYNLYKEYGFYKQPGRFKSMLREGSVRRTRDQWVMVIIVSLLVYMGLLNRALSHDIKNVVQSFYNTRILSQVSKEENLLNSWTFIGLFVLFGFTFGLFLYQVTNYYEMFYSISGVQLFGFFSLLVFGLFAVKLLILRFLGFVFKVDRLVREYISVLYLTYFNITFVFIPVSLCFSLLAARYIPFILMLALITVVVIFVWQYLRSSVNIISNFKFHKFYLFTYLCALEICPILILVKALNN
ncbi:DUF4271 domain-containing protein [Mucilaginibacter daejeonensis]|uniref:DUF4271 domain-containing protein n=1 Tax=Mucilaginibacter daejeonensis TaxID=398049 RepID=UPI001D175272|nr:DUF4271 domain-containing protein [Mucilaginibacter daejeonensis]UEG54301.1 DUF4271 domain-containing protein [Mucilaginibacter daejeonensis]